MAVRFAPGAEAEGDASELGLSRAQLVDMLRYMLLHRGVEDLRDVASGIGPASGCDRLGHLPALTRTGMFELV